MSGATDHQDKVQAFVGTLRKIAHLWEIGATVDEFRMDDSGSWIARIQAAIRECHSLDPCTYSDERIPKNVAAVLSQASGVNIESAMARQPTTNEADELLRLQTDAAFRLLIRMHNRWLQESDSPALMRKIADGLEEGITLASGAGDNGDAKPKTLPAEKGPTATLPKLGPRDTQAWQLSLVPGKTQAKIADALNGRHPGENWTQPRVSEAIKRAKAHAEASGLADRVSAARSRAPARTLDPAAADSGQRTDGRSKHLREKARQIAKEE